VPKRTEGILKVAATGHLPEDGTPLARFCKPTCVDYSGPVRLLVSRDRLARDLRAYGEDGVADQIAGLTEEQMALISERAGQYAVTPDTPSGAGMLLAKAASLAAVEIIEGNARPLERTRRKP
jgi:hypothetical protein